MPVKTSETGLAFLKIPCTALCTAYLLTACAMQLNQVLKTSEIKMFLIECQENGTKENEYYFSMTGNI